MILRYFCVYWPHIYNVCILKVYVHVFSCCYGDKRRAGQKKEKEDDPGLTKKHQGALRSLEVEVEVVQVQSSLGVL